MSDIILEARGITKIFPGVKALDRVDLQVKQGEVHALVGENGAGKSTLMLTLAGIHKPNGGDIYLNGEKVAFDSPYDAHQKGIGIVFQELSLVPNLSVAENIFTHRQPIKRFNMIDSKRLYDQTRDMLALFEIIEIDPATPVRELSIANQQVVEILKAMSLHPKVLILDEPTSSLTDIEVKELFKNIKILKARGISFIYISHHLPEIFEIADTVTVLRDGKYVCDAQVQEIDEDFLVTKMVGRTIGNIYGQREEDANIGDLLFETRKLSRHGVFHDVSFRVNVGEIVTFAGLVGAGRTEVGRAIFGAEPADSGELYLEGRKLSIKTPQHAIEHGIGYMSEDRKNQGLYLRFDLKANFVANRLSDFCDSRGFLNDTEIEAYAEQCVREFGVSTPSIHQKVDNLSGGNQQKVLLGTWFGIRPKLLIVDEPTKGVDVGAKSDIYDLLRKLAKSGVGILMISSDLNEVLGVSDRILVMQNGRIAAELSRKEATEENVIAIASGVQA
ncbi:D-xylose ABC transporter ATP-binding protein [candidate division KSB3 bacterium]|uniref:D-xylose ABC transporter ATP-binding protein n=1 Tax=candidate division KSB3 bacterium TaxID=2044937 RepID=A0A2G6K717_9BACT|nr:MAG: D-xylose ABC transporter ATP-binding protein [candidate division KSB3 bacterium]